MLKIKNKDIIKELDNSLHLYDKLDQVFEDFSVKYNRSFSAIKKAYYRSNSSAERSHGNRKLTNQQEQDLLIIIIIFSNSFVSLSKNMIINVVSSCFKKKFVSIGSRVLLRDTRKN